jgi:hypothetical protein
MIDTTDLNIGNVLSFKKTNLGFIINNFRVQIGWQNGSGLNNRRDKGTYQGNMCLD